MSYFTWRNSEKSSIKYLLVLTIALLLWAGCDGDDCPSCPEPETVSDYNIYVGLFGGTGGIYIYNTKQRSIVDSILGVPRQTNIEVTVEEEYLIGSSQFGGGGTWVMDLQTKQIVKQFSFVGEIEISPNGKYVAIQSDSLRILDAVNFDQILVTIDVTGGHFDVMGDIFYGISAVNTISRINIPRDTIYPAIVWTDPFFLGGRISRVVPTEDTNKIFVWARYGSNSSAAFSYYIDEDSSKLLQNIQSINTDLELTPDGKSLIFTDPLDFIYSASRNVYLTDTDNDHVYAIVPSTFNPALNSSEIAITPDSKLAVFGSIGSQWQGVMSINDREYTDWFAIDTTGSGAYGYSVACRKWLT